jgi:hypothetical protein
MAILQGTSLLKPAYNQPEAGKKGFLLNTYTGGLNKSQGLVTSGTFTIAAVNSNQTVTLSAAFFNNILAVGNLVDILDGSSHEIIGQVVSTSGVTAVIKTISIVQGSAGNTMATAAVVTQVASAAFTAAAVGSNNTIVMATATQASLFAPGDSATITDGTTTIVGTVASVAGTTLNLTTVSFSAGSAGSTVAQYAKFSASPGDRVVFNQDPSNFMPAGAVPLNSQVIVPGSTGSLAFSVGYMSTDQDVTTTNATNLTYFNSATAMATAGRYNEASTTVPYQLPKNAYPTLQASGANAPSAQYFVRMEFEYPGPPASQL